MQACTHRRVPDLEDGPAHEAGRFQCSGFELEREQTDGAPLALEDEEVLPSTAESLPTSRTERCYRMISFSQFGIETSPVTSEWSKSYWSGE